MGQGKDLSVKRIAKDTVLSILALVLMNCVIQFVLYPALRRSLGVDGYGDVLYIIGIVNIVGASVGSACNFGRLVFSVKGKTRNADSLVLLGAVLVLTIPISWWTVASSGQSHSFMQFIMVWILTNATVWRYYADVEFKLTTNYKRYFVYYLFVSIGYIVGVGLYRLTGIWQLILLPGELSGIAYVFGEGDILRWDHRSSAESFKTFAHIVANLLLVQLIINVVLNSDRLVLKPMLGGEAVTAYYIASLIGKTSALISGPLNSVLIGHLAKSKQEMQWKHYLQLSAVCLLIVPFFTAACVLASHIFVRLVYPEDYEMVRELFIMANLAQILYFAAGILMTVLLRYISDKYQVVINLGYIFVFALVTVSMTKTLGLQGFSIGLLISNVFLYLFTMFLGTAIIKARGSS